MELCYHFGMAKHGKLKENGAHVSDIISFYTYMEGADPESLLAVMRHREQNIADVVRLWLHRLHINVSDGHPHLTRIASMVGRRLKDECEHLLRDKPDWPTIVGKVRKSTSSEIETLLRELRTAESGKSDDMAERDRP